MFFSFQFSAVSKWTLSNRLGTTETQCICISMFFFFFIEKHVSVLSNGSCALFMGPTKLFFNKIFIKNGSHGTIYTFKNYFVTVFSVFSFQQNK